MAAAFQDRRAVVLADLRVVAEAVASAGHQVVVAVEAVSADLLVVAEVFADIDKRFYLK